MLCLQIESFVLEYGSALASGVTTWELALDYFVQCPRYGEPSAVALIESQLQSDDPRTGRKIVRICDKIGLRDMKQAVFESQGQKCLQVQIYA